MERILICTDGEDHSIIAEDYAITLASHLPVSLTGLYVQSVFLHKFVHEIYAVGRNECKDHIDSSLLQEGTTALDSLGRRCKERGISFEPRIRKGDVAVEILSEISENKYDMLVMGAKLLNTWRERFESVNVSGEIFKRSPIPVLFAR